MSAFAFFGGMADRYVDIVDSNRKLAAEKKKASAEAQIEAAESTYAFQVPMYDRNSKKLVTNENGRQIYQSLALGTKRTGDTEQERLAYNKAAFRELGTMLDMVKKSDIEYYNLLVNDPTFLNQITSEFAPLFNDIKKPVQLKDDFSAQNNPSVQFPTFERHFPSLLKELESNMGLSYDSLVISGDNIFSAYKRKNNPEFNLESAKQSGELSADDKVLYDFSGLYADWLLNDRDNEKLVPLSKFYNDNELYRRTDALINLIPGAYERRKTENAEGFGGQYTTTTQIDQSKMAVDDKTFTIINSGKFIVDATDKLTQTYAQLGVLRDGVTGQPLNAEGLLKGDILVPAGTGIEFLQRFNDNIFEEGGLGTSLKIVAARFLNKEGVDTTKQFKINGEFKSYDELLDSRVDSIIDLNKKKGQHKAKTVYKDFTKDDKKNIDFDKLDEMTIREGLNIASNPNAYIDTVGLAGIIKAREIALAFNIAIARQGFEGGKAVSDADFDRAYNEITGGGSILGATNIKQKLKKYDDLRDEFSRLALPHVLSNKLVGRNHNHAALTGREDLVRIILGANNMADEDGTEFIGFGGRNYPLSILMENPEQVRRLTSNRGTYRLWADSGALTDNILESEDEKSTEEQILEFDFNSEDEEDKN